jgi:hypothetical protein
MIYSVFFSGDVLFSTCLRKLAAHIAWDDTRWEDGDLILGLAFGVGVTACAMKVYLVFQHDGLGYIDENSN